MEKETVEIEFDLEFDFSQAGLKYPDTADGIAALEEMYRDAADKEAATRGIEIVISFEGDFDPVSGEGQMIDEDAEYLAEVWQSIHDRVDTNRQNAN